MWRTICCCCPCCFGESNATYSALDTSQTTKSGKQTSGSTIAGRAKKSLNQLLPSITRSSQNSSLIGNGPSNTNSRALSHDNQFEIEIDEEEDEGLMNAPDDVSMHEDDHVMDDQREDEQRPPIIQLTTIKEGKSIARSSSTPPHTTNGLNGRHLNGTSSPNHHSITPTRKASPEVASPTNGFEETITRADLEVPDDIDVRLLRALEEADSSVPDSNETKKSRKHDSALSDSIASPFTPTTADLMTALEGVKTPPNVKLPSSSYPTMTAPPHNITPIPVPKVNRKSSIAPVSQSLPNTPYPENTQLLPITQPTVKHLQPSNHQLHQEEQAPAKSLAPPPPAHSSSGLIHSPSAPSLSPEAIQAFPIPDISKPAAAQETAASATSTSTSSHPHSNNHHHGHDPQHPPITILVGPTVAHAPSKKPSTTTTPAQSTTAASKPSAPSNPLDHLKVPNGPISAAHMESIMSLLKQTTVSDVSYAHLFAFLYAATRQLSGKVLRPFVLPELQQIVAHHQQATKHGHLKRSASVSATPNHNGMNVPHPASNKSGLSPEAAKMLVQFLHWLVDIRIDRAQHTILFRFDFGTGEKYHYIDMPSVDTWVLSSKHSTDPFLYHPLNQPKIYKNDSHRLCLHSEILLNFTPQGLTSLRSGDVSIKKFVSFNCELRTEYRPGMIEYDNAKNAFIQMDEVDETKPIIVNGHYVPRTFDYWLVCTVLKQEVWVGLPIIGTPAPSNIHMKPHKDYPYP